MIVVRQGSDALPEGPELKFYAYQDESGEPGKKSYFLVGVLIADEHARDMAAKRIHDIRVAHHFSEEFHFKKISACRYSVYQDVLQSISTLDVRFCALVVRNEILDLSYFSNKRYLAYNRFTYLALYNNVRTLAGDLYVYSDARDRITDDNFLEYIKNQLEFDALAKGNRYSVRAVEARDSRKEELLQLTDILLGATNSLFNRPENKYKNLLAVQLQDLRARYPHKVNIWIWRPNQRKANGGKA